MCEMSEKDSVGKLGDLAGAGYNPRQISRVALAGLRESLATFGDLSGVVFNARSGSLICGHQRRAALAEVDLSGIVWGEAYEVEIGYAGQRFRSREQDGWFTLPDGARFRVRRVEWDLAFEKAANVSANNPCVQGEFIEESLAEVLRELRADNAQAFEDLCLDDLVDWLALSPEDTGAGGAGDSLGSEEPEGPTIAQPGDLWTLGRHRVLCGDSENPDDVARLLDGQKPLLMVTDPPYGVEYDPTWREAATGQKVRATGKVANDDRADWRGAWELFGAEAAYVWHAGLFADKVADSLRACGYDLVSQIIWAKQHFVLSRGDYHWQHEPCWYAVKHGCKHNWQGARDQATLWQIANNCSHGGGGEKQWGHGTQKPLECMVRPIRNNTPRKALVVDPFLGSGTTLIACEQTGRHCYGMELDPRYVDMIVRRWEAETGRVATKVA